MVDIIHTIYSFYAMHIFVFIALCICVYVDITVHVILFHAAYQFIYVSIVPLYNIVKND